MTRILTMVLALSLAGCGEENTEPAHETPEEEGPVYDLRANPSDGYQAGQAGTFEVVLTGRGGYHVNTDPNFPFAIRLSGPSQVTFPRTDLDRDDAAEFSEERARFAIPFTPSAAGSHRVSATVDFAVCTPSTCLPEQETLAVVLPVE